MKPYGTYLDEYNQWALDFQEKATESPIQSNIESHTKEVETIIEEEKTKKAKEKTEKKGQNEKEKGAKKAVTITNFSGKELYLLDGYTAKYSLKKSSVENGKGCIYINLYDENDKKKERFEIHVTFSTKVERSFTGEDPNRVLGEFSIGSKMKKIKNGWEKHYFSSQEFDRLRIFIRAVLSDKKYNQDLQN